eukprot:scaffold89231_cov25-Tisochrysis_lutea.AAC.6
MPICRISSKHSGLTQFVQHSIHDATMGVHSPCDDHGGDSEGAIEASVARAVVVHDRDRA